MSTMFRPLTLIPMTHLVDDRLESVGVHEVCAMEVTTNKKCLIDGRWSGGIWRDQPKCIKLTPNKKCLTDGHNNFLWAFGDEKSLVFVAYGMNEPEGILNGIADEFGVRIVSQHEPEFWGWKSEEEWKRACEEKPRPLFSD